MSEPTSQVASEIDALVATKDRDRLVHKIRRLIDQFVENADVYNEEQVATFDEVISRLMSDVDYTDKAEISEWLADQPKAPPRVIEQLADDDSVEVAEPVLTRSECLPHETLLRIVTTRGQSHLLAISKRKKIAAALTDALIVKGNQMVVRALARNGGAEFSRNGAALLAQRKQSRYQELRRAPRKDVQYPASVIIDSAPEPLRCMLMDISKTGARVSLAKATRVPSKLMLNLGGKDNVCRRCELVWQDGRMLGVRFL